MKFTSSSDAIVTLGMKTTRPETGYGYIEADLTMACPSNKEIYRVDAFKEKPDLETAKRYIQKKNYFWNAGIFVWNVNTIVNALRVYQPALSKIFEKMLPYLKPMRYMCSLHLSDGVIWVHGALCMRTRQKTPKAMYV